MNLLSFSSFLIRSVKTDLTCLFKGGNILLVKGESSDLLENAAFEGTFPYCNEISTFLKYWLLTCSQCFHIKCYPCHVYGEYWMIYLELHIYTACISLVGANVKKAAAKIIPWMSDKWEWYNPANPLALMQHMLSDQTFIHQQPSHTMGSCIPYIYNSLAKRVTAPDKRPIENHCLTFPNAPPTLCSKCYLPLLPLEVISYALAFLDSVSLHSSSIAYSDFNLASRKLYPGLIVPKYLYDHQFNAADWMLERENHNEDKKSLRSLAARFITDVSVCAHPVWVSRQLFEGSGFDADGATRITNGKTQQRKGSMVVMHRITGELLCTTTAVFTGSSTMSEQPWGYAGSKVRGGMLCDEPGLGKTITMLAVILKTLGYQPDCLRDCVTSRSSSRQSNTNPNTQSSVCGSSTADEVLNKRKVLPYPNKQGYPIYVSSATIILVPDVLVNQWRQQIDQHSCPKVLSKVYIDAYTSSRNNIALPPVETLADYDVIVLSFSRLSDEYRKDKAAYYQMKNHPDENASIGNEMDSEQHPSKRSRIHSPTPSSVGSRSQPRASGAKVGLSYIPGASRSNARPTVLNQIYFFRKIIDEGHGCHGCGDMITMAKDLNSERVWLLTGTPTPALSGAVGGSSSCGDALTSVAASTTANPLHHLLHASVPQSEEAKTDDVTVTMSKTESSPSPIDSPNSMSTSTSTSASTSTSTSTNSMETSASPTPTSITPTASQGANRTVSSSDASTKCSVSSELASFTARIQKLLVFLKHEPFGQIGGLELWKKCLQRSPLMYIPLPNTSARTSTACTSMSSACTTSNAIEHSAATPSMSTSTVASSSSCTEDTNHVAPPVCTAGFRVPELLIHTLQEIMLRQAKKDIPQIPPPIRIYEYLDMNEYEAKSYNAIVNLALSNLVTTGKDTKYPVGSHPDSLLNPKNGKFRRQMLRNIRIASCGGGHAPIVLINAHKNIQECLDLLADWHASEAVTDRVRSFIFSVLDGRHSTTANTLPSVWNHQQEVLAHENDVVNGVPITCEWCGIRDLGLLLITPCGHFYCSECMGVMGDYCQICRNPFDWSHLQLLQPGFEARDYILDRAVSSSNPVGDDLVSNTASSGVFSGPLHTSNSTDSTSTSTGEYSTTASGGGGDRSSSGEGIKDSTICSKARFLIEQISVLEAAWKSSFVKDNRWLRRHNHCDGSSSNSNSNSSDHPLGAKSTSTVSFSVNTGGSLKGDRNDPARDALHSHLLTPKIIVFSQFPEFLDCIAIGLRAAGITFLTLDNKQDNARTLQQFQHQAASRVLLLGKYGALGLNLAYVTHIYLMEPILDSSLEQQVIARAYRMGCRQSVVVTQLVMKNTIEQDIQRLHHGTLSEDQDASTSGISQVNLLAHLQLVRQ